MDVDVLIRGAAVVDGTGHPRGAGDVAVTGAEIVGVGRLAESLRAGRVIEAPGLVTCPGFIDIHTHSDLSLVLDPRAESKVHQGVTTEVVGNCGFSPFPLNAERRPLLRGLMAMVGDAPAELAWRDLEGYASALQARAPAVNVAPLVGHGALRIAVMGLEDRRPRDDELRALRWLLGEALEQGAFGLSTGLTYVPSRFAEEPEIQALAGVLSTHGRLYATHARTGADRALAAVVEAIGFARRSGARLQYSHAALNEPAWWGRAADVTEVFERARQGGVDVGFDVYPYAASSSALTQYLPVWVQAGGEAAMASRLGDSEVKLRAESELSDGWGGGIPWLWDRVVLASAEAADEFSPGRSILALAEDAGMRPSELVLDLCARFGNQVQVVLFYRTEEDMLTFLRHPLAVVGSDGNALPLDLGERRPHPRSFGTYPRILGRYVREQRALGLEDAIHKMTGAAADRLGLRDRGRLAPGMAADIVVFDPERILDRAEFGAPGRAPEGIVHVLVNGQLAVESGRATGARSGRVLRAA